MNQLFGLQHRSVRHLVAPKKFWKDTNICQVFFEIGCEPPKKVYYYCEMRYADSKKEFFDHIKQFSLKKFGHSKKKPYLCTNRTRHASRRPANQGGAFFYIGQ